MATNDFIPVAPGPGANVLTQTAYASSAAASTGYQSGVAPSAGVNKSLRQGTVMAAVLAQLIVDNTGQNAVDDGTTATLLANLKLATNGRLVNIQVFLASGTYTPTVGATKARVRGMGAGGAGCGTASVASTSNTSIGPGGHAGAYGEIWISSGLTATAVTVGNGGIGVVGGAGPAGGASSFGTLMVCGGGPSSSGIVTAAPPILTFAGTGSPATVTGTGTILVKGFGALGGPGFALTGVQAIGGQGANTQWGEGGQNSSSSGFDAGGYGSGGSGSLSSQGGVAAKGGTGSPGIIIVEEYR